MSTKKKIYYKLTEKALEESGDKIEFNTKIFHCGRNKSYACVILCYLLLQGNIIAPQHNGSCKIIPSKFCEDYNFTYYDFVKGMEKLHKYGFVRFIGKNQETGEFEFYIEQDNPIKQYGKLRTRAERRKYHLKWD